MLLLTFRAAESLYAVGVARVIEVVPRVELRRLPHAPAFLSGIFDYRGSVVPVIDLGILLGAGACRDRMSTRIILVDSHPAGDGRKVHPADAQDAAPDEPEAEPHDGPAAGKGQGSGAVQRHVPQLLGLAAEQVLDLVAVEPGQVLSTAMNLPDAPYLGAVVGIEGEMAQLILADRILGRTLRAAVFGDDPDGGPSGAAETAAKAGLP